MIKKQRWIKEESNKTLTKIFLGFVFVFGSISLIWWLNSTSYICSKNPAKCVYEPTQKLYEDSCVTNPTRENSCLQFDDTPEEYCLSQGSNALKMFCTPRLKTQAELDIDDCNNNPRGDINCKCVEISKHYYDLRCRDFHDNLWMIIGGITENISNLYPDGKLFLGCSVGFNNECIKSHPKNPCEKGDKNYIEVKGYSACLKGESDIECLNNPQLITTCREKTDVEKSQIE